MGKVANTAVAMGAIASIAGGTLGQPSPSSTATNNGVGGTSVGSGTSGSAGPKSSSSGKK